MGIKSVTLILLPFIVHFSEPYNFTQMEEPMGIFIIKTQETFIAYNNWKLYYFLELDEFYEDINQLRQIIMKIQTLCTIVTEKDQCIYLIERFERHMKTIDRDLEFIKTFQRPSFKRFKRAPLGFVITYLYNPIFGIMGEEDAKAIAEKMNELIQRNEDYKIIVTEELSIMKQSLILTYNVTSDLKSNIQILDQKIDELILNVKNQVMQHITIQYLSTIAILVITEHENSLRTLKEITKSTFVGDFTELVPISQFRNDLLKITEELPPEASLFIDNENEVKSIVSLRHFMTYNRIMIEITVPILNKSPYQLTRVTTLPIKLGNRTIIIDTENQYYLVNIGKQEYIPITESELEKCKKMSEDRIVCSPQTEAYLRNEEVCESGIIFGSDLNNILYKCNYKYLKESSFIKHLDQNKYYVSTMSPINVTEKCGKEYTTSILKNTGILTLFPFCELRTEGMKISTKNTRTSDPVPVIESPYHFSELSPLNLKNLENRHTEIKVPKLEFINYDKNFEKLTSNIDQSSNKVASMPEIKKMILDNNGFQWSAWHTLILCVAIIIIIIIKKSL